MEISVCKIGGGALGVQKNSTPEEIRAAYDRALAIIDECKDRVILVLSALGKTTADLLSISRSPSPITKRETFEEVAAFHLRVARALKTDSRYLKALLADLEQKACASSEGSHVLPQEAVDEILSFGERMSVQIAVDYLRKKGASVGYVSALRLVATGDTHHKGAVLDMLQTRKNCARLESKIGRFDVVLTEGYIGKNQKTGAITLLGWNGSDLTAALLAGICKAKLFLYKKIDKDGIPLEDCTAQVFREIFRGTGLVHDSVFDIMAEFPKLTLYITDIDTGKVFTISGSDANSGDIIAKQSN